MGHEGHEHEHGHGHGGEHRLTFFASPLRDPKPNYSSTPESEVDETNKLNHEASTLPLANNDGCLHDTPAFHRHAEATTSELFYDLFFVANLTTFTANLYINSGNALSAYAGFFCILWFTWYQVSLYDLRFTVDSVYDRICKALQFGVMVGFAVVGPQWDPSEEKYDFAPFRIFSLILMASRIFLVFQYASAMYFTRAYRRTHVPLALTIILYIISAVIYLGIYFSFPKDGEERKSRAYIAWYVVSVVETMSVLGISGKWRVISFKGTHMVQRMSLLTLIILGEGIIVICKAISYIVKNSYAFSSAIVGQIISSILIIYFLYMLYFDRMQEDHFGTIKQQIWSFIHFPLHLSLVLLLCGVSQFVIWRQAVESANALDNQLLLDLSTSYTNASEFAASINATVSGYVFDWIPKDFDASDAMDTVSKSLGKISNMTEVPIDDLIASGDESFAEAFNSIYYASFNTILETLGIKPPKSKDASKTKTGEDSFAETAKLLKVIQTVFLYFFIAAGVSLILLGALGAISKPPKTLGGYARNIGNFVVGTGLCLLSIMSITEAGGNYVVSPWILPTVCLSFGAVVVSNHLHRFWKKKSV